MLGITNLRKSGVKRMNQQEVEKKIAELGELLRKAQKLLIEIEDAAFSESKTDVGNV